MKFLKLGRLLPFLSLILGFAMGQDRVEGPLCQWTDWNFDNTPCQDELMEMFRHVDGLQQARYCCNPKHKAFKNVKSAANGCRTTECQSSTPADLCTTIDARFINNGTTQLEYEEILKESCSLDKGQGVAGLCCVRNSTESFLASVLGAESNEFPHQAKLKLGCGGTVYNKKFIITAAHCLADEITGEISKPGEIEVVLGSNIGDTTIKEYLYGVKKIIIHPEYSLLNGSSERETEEPRYFNDIALMELDREIQFGDKVKALEIAPEGFVPINFADSAIIVGWGTTDTLDLAAHLQKANFLIRSDQSCYINETGPWAEYSGYEDQLLCVGGILDGKWSPTAGGGDSGGPAICRGADGRALLCGITSFGGGDDDTECVANDDEESCPPSTYVVAFFHDWIKQNAGEQDPITFYKPYVYGKRIQLDQYEHQVRITTNEGLPCGGTLIAPDVVVTAAHCIASGAKPGESFSNLTVTTGLNEVTGIGQIFGVKAVTLLPYFEKDGELTDPSRHGNRVIISEHFYINDLAVIKLSRNVSHPKTFPKLPPRGYQPQTEIGVEMAFPRSTKYSPQMNQRHFRFLDKGECQTKLNRMSRVGLDIKIDRDILCGVETYSGGSLCDRELGGGVICRGEKGEDILCGVQVFRMCEFSLPNAFIDVAIYSNWIHKIALSKNEYLQNMK